MKESVSKIRIFRIKNIIMGFFAFMFIVIFRLFYLQIDRQHQFYSLGERNFLRVEVITPLRGDVYDCNKVLLAANKAVFDLYWQGSGVQLSREEHELLARLSQIMGVDITSDPKLFQGIVFASKKARRFLLKEDLSFQQLCMISELSQNVSSLVVENRFKRVYPHHQLASHVLGFLSRSDNVGKAGIESRLHDDLKGVEGRRVHVITATGRSLMQRIDQEARAGKDLALTLDFNIQKIAESLFAPEQSGAVVVMDPFDGSVKALVSYPQYDPNLFLSPLSEAEWEAISFNNPLLNRATSALYPPASTFKLITMAAALEDKLVDPHQEFFCRGYVEYCGRRYHCLNRLGHGSLNPRMTLSRSCNIPFFHIAKKININRLAYFANCFGLGKKTDFILPEKQGLIPTTAWKKQVFGERWWRGENLSACIGQSYLLVTPLQLARMVSAVCAGFLVKPRLLADEPIERELVPISQDTLNLLKCGMRDAVIEGSARRMAHLKSFDIWAKTGTAQTCSLSLSQEKDLRKYTEHGWCISFFSYKRSRPLALVIMLEHTGHSRFTTALAENFMRKYQRLMEEGTYND